MQTERKKRTGIQLCYPFELDRLSGPSRKAWNQWPVIVQPKLDGERCRAIVRDGTVSLRSSTDEEIISVPHISMALSKLHGPIELDGELYIHGASFEEIHSIVSRKSIETIHNRFEDVEYHVFDIIENRPQLLRLDTLANLKGLPAPIQVVQHWFASDTDDVLRTIELAMIAQYEGVIVRHLLAPYERKRSTNIMKFKPKKDDIYIINGFQEEIDKEGKPKGTLGAFLVHSIDTPGSFAVGTGFTREQRQLFWKARWSTVGKKLRVAYQSLTEARIPRFPVFVELLDDEKGANSV